MSNEQRRKVGSVDPEQAERLALEALAYLAGEPELLPRFLALSGIEAAAIRQAAAEPGFLAGVLAFFTAHEPSLQKLAEATGHKPEEFASAAAALPNGENRYDRST